MPSSQADTGPYAAANRRTTYQACQGAEAKRKYQAVTVEVNCRCRPLSGNASYT
jgi:hypothetical protein